jgi:hypothetical protein
MSTTQASKSKLTGAAGKGKSRINQSFGGSSGRAANLNDNTRVDQLRDESDEGSQPGATGLNADTGNSGAGANPPANNGVESVESAGSVESVNQPPQDYDADDDQFSSSDRRDQIRDNGFERRSR